ncbi:MAG: UDP-N-acetylglucosamine--N-acetylmuramyl-(pentapeptide) pyrophosphoryl-undecaprenol N-acetylglucosamine transferase [Elusimicrobiales bacterium]|nr:UDP-N-acetylglucosamine--N-acetylmuramyl-(pentapeptide) pyrophosphoryl-undecaprenol N-acetylglucosamine transferase [Elusimicrobiales bacterium]
MKKVLIACGGTGGHFYPGYAVGLELKRRGWEPLFALRKNDPAAATLDAARLPWTQADITGLSRSLDLTAHAAFVWKAFRAVRLARNVIADWRPDAVIGTGGYVSFPFILAARIAGVPSLIHESNTVFGLANAACARFAGAVALGLPLGKGSPRGAIVTGTPVRESFSSPLPRGDAARLFGLDPALKTALVFGGSQGARALNSAVFSAELALAAKNPQLQFLHVSGRLEYPALLKRNPPPRIKLLEYCDNMHAAFSSADIVICRGGAGTAAELIAEQKPAILVPLPTAAGQHQEKNARVLEKSGCAVMARESASLEADIAAMLTAILSDDGRLEAMRRSYRTAGFADPLKAAAAIADLAEKIARRR